MVAGDAILGQAPPRVLPTGGHCVDRPGVGGKARFCCGFNFVEVPLKFGKSRSERPEYQYNAAAYSLFALDPAENGTQRLSLGTAGRYAINQDQVLREFHEGLWKHRSARSGYSTE